MRTVTQESVFVNMVTLVMDMNALKVSTIGLICMATPQDIKMFR